MLREPQKLSVTSGYNLKLGPPLQDCPLLLLPLGSCALSEVLPITKQFTPVPSGRHWKVLRCAHRTDVRAEDRRKQLERKPGKRGGSMVGKGTERREQGLGGWTLSRRGSCWYRPSHLSATGLNRLVLSQRLWLMFVCQPQRAALCNL